MSNILITFLILWLLYKESLSFRFKVFSTDSVSVTLGSDVMLPCILSPEMSGENMEIRWFKIQYQPYVHLYENRKDDYTAQKPEFTNRTELLKENITRGVFPLLIRNVTAQDSGEYHCYVESSNHHGRAKVQLNVNAVGSLPVISLITDHTMSCESHDWHPKPYLTWTDNERNKIIPSMVKVFKDENSFYHIISFIHLSNASDIICTVSIALNHSKDSRQIIERRLPVTARNTYSHFLVICASIILIFFVCICLLLKCLGDLQNKHEDVLAAQAKLSNGKPHTEASYNSPV
ncbi:selection and upkeep of intraepithelial T-cells protein 2-like isoform X2 [Xenopus laevis]|uniref:Selection and upkeep of intraepithelial T-cells protein 2-like isoform X2 n=1 Tax=Xenopus laevis TaxID=8355 RepID=A0A8J1LLE1_XENLA|nr:selection and upkeep of intraepithelial T-cells protein 2-like isoform X2 [Xenopus laevis]